MYSQLNLLYCKNMPLHVSNITWSSSDRFSTGKNQIYYSKHLWCQIEIKSDLVTGQQLYSK